MPAVGDQLPQVQTDITEDAALGGKIKLRQPARGHRFGHDAILLAAAVPAKPGERAVDFGAGVGAAGLALATRVSGVDVTLAERDTALAALAADNIRANSLTDRARAVALDITAKASAFDRVGLMPGSADHVLMNPPFNDATRQRPSLDAARRAAHVAPPDLLAAWVRTARRVLRAGGTLTLIWRADGLADGLGVLANGFGGIVILPVHPKPGAAAIRVIVHGIKGSRGPLSVLPGLVLADGGGNPSAPAEAVLRDAAPLRMTPAGHDNPPGGGGG